MPFTGIALESTAAAATWVSLAALLTPLQCFADEVATTAADAAATATNAVTSTATDAAGAASNAVAAATDAVSTAAASGEEGPLGFSAPEVIVLATPVLLYGFFTWFRNNYNPKASFLDYVYLLAFTAIVGNIISILVFKTRWF